MCIIVAIPQGKAVSKSTLKRCWDNNPHGGGFMYTNGNKVVVHKEMASFKKYWKAYSSAKETTNSPMVCHFRISTHGKINETNCHPFLVSKNLGFVHNGIIYNAPKSENFSDTYMFNEAILKHLPTNFLNNTAHVSLIANYIGTGSKLAFLNLKGEITIINEKAGVWDDGVWYSNSGYKAYNYFDYGGTKVGSVTTFQPKQSNIPFPTTPQKKEDKIESRGDDCKNHDCIDSDVSAKPFVYDELDWYGNPKKHMGCDYCGTSLATSGERINGCCTNCFDIMNDESINDWLGYKKR
jgi:glutamine amidotransferase